MWEDKLMLVRATQEWSCTWTQRAEKVVSNNQGLVDETASAVVWEIQITEELQSLLLIKNFLELLKRLLG